MRMGMVVVCSLLIAFGAIANQDDTSLIGQSQIDQNITPVPHKAADRSIDEFGPLHDPELIMEFTEGPQNHMFGIAWDGTYYWTINGGNSSGLLNYYDENGTFAGTSNVAIDGRGIVFNPVDELLYISSYQGNIYRIDDPFTGATTMVGSGVMQNGQASLGMSWDGNLLYDYSEGVLEVHDFWTYDLVDVISGINSGTGNYGGGCAIIVDTDYFYTIDTTVNELYVYTLGGTYVDTYVLPYGDNGMSLSMANYMVFYSTDSDYDIGTWHGYSLRDWTEGPVQFNLIPQITTVPQGGGDVYYDASLVSELPGTYNNLFYRSYITLPNGQVVGPQANIPFVHTPFMNVLVQGLTQYVPPLAPAGQYNFEGRIYYMGSVQLVDDFYFTKEGVAADDFVFNPEDWTASGFSIAGTADALPSEFALSEAFPNPFNPTTQLNVTLPNTAELTVQVYNLAGQRVATLANSQMQAGEHSLTFDGSNLSSGLYFVHASVPGQLNQIRKVTLLK